VTIDLDGESIDLLSPADLVLAKKTQRDKDWPMIRRLLEQSFLLARESSDPVLLEFWLREMRTPELLIRVVAQHPDAARRFAPHRPAVEAALNGDPERIVDALDQEQREEGRKDRAYWEPLKREL
jgi:DNA-binding GntR family transcriptional regulator